MLSRDEKIALEEQYERDLSLLQRAEESLTDYFNEFDRQSRRIIEEIYEVCVKVDSRPDAYIADLEENLHLYTQGCYDRQNLLDEIRAQTKREFEDKWES